MTRLLLILSGATAAYAAIRFAAGDGIGGAALALAALLLGFAAVMLEPAE